MTIRRRRGMALIVVMVLTLLVALGAYGFTAHMQSEYRAAKSAVERAQARQAALSGLDTALTMVSMSPDLQAKTGGIENNVELFQARPLELDASLTDQVTGWQYSIVAPLQATANGSTTLGDSASLSAMATAPSLTAGPASGMEPSQAPFRFGLENETSKIHLPTLAMWDRLNPGHAQKVLMSLPEADEDKVRALLVVLGIGGSGRGRNSNPSSTNPSPNLSESNAGSSSGFSSRGLGPIGTSQGARGQRDPYATLDASDLYDRGASDQQSPAAALGTVWHGGDWNHNYRIDPFEQWIQSSANAISAGGSDVIERRLSSESAAPLRDGAPGWERYLTWDSGFRNINRAGLPRVFLNQPDLQALHQQLSTLWSADRANYVIAFRQYGITRTPRILESTSAASWQPTFDRPGARWIESLVDLVGTTVDVLDSQRKVVRLTSPFSSENGGASDYIDRLFDDATLIPADVVVGPVDVRSANREVLLAIPGMVPELADKILASRQSGSDQGINGFSIGSLVRSSVGDLPTLRRILPWISFQSDVYSAQVIGYRDDKSSVFRCSAVLDGRQFPAKAIHFRQWHGWDRGFELESLQGPRGRSP